MANRLAGSTSSYLKKAGNEPIMARESWDDPETARMVNELFVPVKVDRDERPDLDKAYQEAVGILAGVGGWPLTVFLTPEKIPFYGGTYYPKETRQGMPSFKEVLLAVSMAYHKDPGAVQRTATELKRLLEKVPARKGAIDASMLVRATGDILANFDTANGGFGRGAKFPMSEILLFLLQRYEGSGDVNAWHVIDKTLRAMASGGFYDQVGGGFHRYTVDAAWKVPHFEKMLNDNALLLRVYLDACRLSGFVYFRQVAGETIDFVFRRMAREPAGFVSSIDADLHGEEGGYYTWTEREIREVLGDRADEFIKAYGVEPSGNFEVPGKNVLYAPGEVDKSKFAAEKRKLLEARRGRELPFIDTSIHASWTALMATSLAVACEVLESERCLSYATNTMDFMMRSMYKDGTLYRIYTDRPSTEGFLDDYSCATEALLELHRCRQESEYLDKAVGLMADCDSKFYDREHGGYFYVQEKDRTPVVMDKPAADFSVPGPNSQMALNLIKLRYYTGEERYLDRAREILDIFAGNATAYPMGCGAYFSALDYYLHRPIEAVIEADRSQGLPLVRLVNSHAGKAIVMLDTGEGKRLAALEGKARIGGKPTVYFCGEGACKEPMTDTGRIEGFLKKRR